MPISPQVPLPMPRCESKCEKILCWVYILNTIDASFVFKYACLSCHPTRPPAQRASTITHKYGIYPLSALCFAIYMMGRMCKCAQCSRYRSTLTCIFLHVLRIVLHVSKSNWVCKCRMSDWITHFVDLRFDGATIELWVARRSHLAGYFNISISVEPNFHDHETKSVKTSILPVGSLEPFAEADNNKQ